MKMKNIRKAAALIAATVLCMSMSMGVLASSPTDPEMIQEEHDNTEWYYAHMLEGASVENVDGKNLTVTPYGKLEEEVINTLRDEEQIKEILTEAGYEVKENQNIVVIGAGNLKLRDMETYEEAEVPEGGIDVTLGLGWHNEDGTGNKDLQGIQNGDTLYILHQKTDGTWEVLEGKAVVTDKGRGYLKYSVSAHFDSLSPVAVIKVMSNGDVVVLDKDGNKKGNLDMEAANKTNKVKGESSQIVKATAEKKSPKTGN